MLLIGQPPPSEALKTGYELLEQGQVHEGSAVVKKAAMRIKAKFGSGSHELAQAYADMARYHLRAGQVERAAQEFLHASKGPTSSVKEERQDRLAMMFGYGIALGEIGKLEEAEKVLRQCLAFARNVNGGRSASAAAAQVPLAEVLLQQVNMPEASKFAVEAYESLWKLGDSQIIAAVIVRAEVFKATGRAENPFADLDDLPDEIAAAAVSAMAARVGKGDPARTRALLADLLAFVDKKYGDGHELTCDVLAAVAHHELAQGDQADLKIRRTAIRRSIWSFTVRRISAGLLANLEVGFDAGGAIHLAPHLSREPSPAEAAQIEAVLSQAVDDLYSRPAVRA
jgi:tetratricopeptide (TPR) repeat protein